MHDILPDTTPGLLAIRISGTLTGGEVAAFHEWLHERLADHADPAALILMDGFEGWGDAAAVVEEIKLDMHHHADVSRVAMVGEKVWQETMTILSAPFATADVRYFDRTEFTKALTWAKTG